MLVSVDDRIDQRDRLALPYHRDRVTDGGVIQH